MSISPDRHLSVSCEPTSPLPAAGVFKFKSPYLFSKVTCETGKIEWKLRDSVFQRSVEKKTTVESTEEDTKDCATTPDIHTSQTPTVDVCPACGLSLADAQVVERLKEDENETVRDIKYSLEALRLLRVLGFELNPQSRKLHHHLIEQLKFAIFPLEENGKHSAASYFSIYSALDSERKQLRHAFEAKEASSHHLESELKRLSAELSLSKSQSNEWREKAEESKKKLSDLSGEMTRLTTALVEIQSQTDNQEALNLHLASEIRVKSRVFNHKERAHHSLHLHHEQTIAELQRQLRAIDIKDDSELLASLQELHSLRIEVKQLKCDLQRVKKLHEVMRKCYENDMKVFKEYQRERADALLIDEGPNTLKFMQRVKKNLQHYVTLSGLTGANVVNQSFDEVVELTATVIINNNARIEELAGELERLKKQYCQLEVSKQALVEELSEVRSRLRFTEMYEENFQLRAANNENKFVGLGKTLDVPRYLRVSGFVSNLCLSKSQIESMVAEIWEMKIQWQNRIKKSTPMHIFLYNFLRNKFNYFPKVAEYGYNLMDGAEKYSESPDCDLFLSVVKGELPEAVYADNVRMVRLFHGYLQQYNWQKRRGEISPDIKIGDKAVRDILNSEEILQCVRSFFPLKSAKDMEACRILLDQDALALCCKSHSLPFDRLFTKDPERPHHRFIECLRKQMLMDLYSFYTKVSYSLLALCDQSTETVTVLQLITVLGESEMGLSKDDIKVKLAPVLGSFLEDMKTPLGMEFVMRKLKAGYVRPVNLYDPKAKLPL